MRAVITVVGKDRTGIIAKISETLYQHQVNIVDISQNVMEDMFAMVMLVNIDKCTVEFSTLADLLDKDGEELGITRDLVTRTSSTLCTKSKKLRLKLPFQSRFKMCRAGPGHILTLRKVPEKLFSASV